MRDDQYVTSHYNPLLDADSTPRSSLKYTLQPRNATSRVRCNNFQLQSLALCLSDFSSPFLHEICLLEPVRTKQVIADSIIRMRVPHLVHYTIPPFRRRGVVVEIEPAKFQRVLILNDELRTLVRQTGPGEVDGERRAVVHFSCIDVRVRARIDVCEIGYGCVLVVAALA